MFKKVTNSIDFLGGSLTLRNCNFLIKILIFEKTKTVLLIYGGNSLNNRRNN